MQLNTSNAVHSTDSTVACNWLAQIHHHYPGWRSTVGAGSSSISVACDVAVVVAERLVVAPLAGSSRAAVVVASWRFEEGFFFSNLGLFCFFEFHWSWLVLK